MATPNKHEYVIREGVKTFSEPLVNYAVYRLSGLCQLLSMYGLTIKANTEYRKNPTNSKAKSNKDVVEKAFADEVERVVNTGYQDREAVLHFISVFYAMAYDIDIQNIIIALS